MPEEFYPNILYVLYIFLRLNRYIYVNLGILAFSKMKMMLATAGGELRFIISTDGAIRCRNVS